MSDFDGGRRAFLGASASAGAIAFATGRGAAAGGEPAVEMGEDAFRYEVQLPDAEWRERLSEEEYVVLRKGSTELPQSSELWDETAEGVYGCRGCGLALYDSVWKVELDIGYAFFRQSRENAILMGIDGDPPYGTDDDGPFGAMIETHCRRCGSHLGHILGVRGDTLHCINGISLTFAPTSA